MSGPDMVCGTVKLGWQIKERDLGLPDKPSKDDWAKFYDRLEDLISSAFHQRVTIWIDGEAKPGVDVVLEQFGDFEVEIDEGPVNGTLSDLREELEDPDDDG